MEAMRARIPATVFAIAVMAGFAQGQQSNDASAVPRPPNWSMPNYLSPPKETSVPPANSAGALTPPPVDAGNGLPNPILSPCAEELPCWKVCGWLTEDFLMAF